MQFKLLLLSFMTAVSINIYPKKEAMSGFFKRSSVNGLTKVNPTSGHYRHTSKGYTYVNPYARSR